MNRNKKQLSIRLVAYKNEIECLIDSIYKLWEYKFIDL